MGKFALGIFIVMIVLGVISVTTGTDSFILKGAFVGCIFLLLIIGFVSIIGKGG